MDKANPDLEQTLLDPKAQLDAAAVYDDKGRLRGHNVIKKSGDLVLRRPGELSLAATPERGTFVDGLKEGERLASPADVEERRAEVNDARKGQGKPPV